MRRPRREPRIIRSPRRRRFWQRQCRRIGNDVRGSFARSGIFFSEGIFSSTASTVHARAYMNSIRCGGDGAGQGVGFVPQNGSIDLQAINNTVVGCNDGILTLE